MRFEIKDGKLIETIEYELTLVKERKVEFPDGITHGICWWRFGKKHLVSRGLTYSEETGPGCFQACNIFTGKLEAARAFDALVQGSKQLWATQ